jgi:SPP1 gp7 family putative phage head morphogenesis protein
MNAETPSSRLGVLFLLGGRKGKNIETLKPSPIKDSDYADIEAQLLAIFYDLVFRPLVEVLRPHDTALRGHARDLARAGARIRQMRNSRLSPSELWNAPQEDPLISALKAGLVQYSGTTGAFSGKFNAAISSALKKLGAKFDRRSGVFFLSPDKVPPSVRAAAHMAEEAMKKVHDELLRRLAETEGKLDALVDEKVNRRTLNATVMLDKVAKRDKKAYGDALGVDELDEAAKERLAHDYAENVKPNIKKFVSEDILKLRAMIEKNANEGWRFDRLVSRIEHNFKGVTPARAQLIARTETSIYVSKVRQSRFEQVGVTEYIWRTAGDSRVREDHRSLNGRRFFYAHPPIIDERTGERGNPGETYNCRCTAQPILPTLSSILAPRENSAAPRQLEAVPA